MLDSLKLLLPTIIPSWRFFDWIAPSPRIEYRLSKSQNGGEGGWQEFRPRPAHVSIVAMFKRLFWNPVWNENLYLVSCSEKLLETESEHYSREILACIKSELGDAALPYLQFRLMLVSRQGDSMVREPAFISPIYRGREDA